MVWKKFPSTAPQDASIEDLGGPTNQNYKQDDNSSKIANKGTSQIKGNAVNKNAGAPDGPAGITKAEETEVDGEIVEEEINVDDDVKALLTGEELSEEFKAKTKTIFEGTVKSKINEQRKRVRRETLKRNYQRKLMRLNQNFLKKWISSFLMLPKSGKKRNELEIHNGIKLEMYGSFMDGMKKLFEENYVSIPEEKYDVLDEMTNKLDEMEEKLNEQIDKNVSLSGTINARTRESLIAEVSKGLGSDTGREACFTC